MSREREASYTAHCEISSEFKHLCRWAYALHHKCISFSNFDGAFDRLIRFKLFLRVDWKKVVDVGRFSLNSLRENWFPFEFVERVSVSLRGEPLTLSRFLERRTVTVGADEVTLMLIKLDG